MYLTQLATLPPPVSVSIAWRPMARSDAASGAKVASMLLVTHSTCVPELSESRYLWMSKIRFVVLPSKFLTPLRASREPLETKVPAEVQLLPGRRIIWEVAPAERMAVTTAWAVAPQVVMLGTDEC